MDIGKEAADFKEWYDSVYIGDGDTVTEIPKSIYDSGYSDYMTGYNLALGAWAEKAKRLQKSEISRTELIKQNAALAAENERLEVKLANSESGSISWRKSYHIALEKLVAAKAVIKAAQEQECDADRYRFIRSIGGITWTLSNKQDGELLRYRAEDEAYDSLVDEEIKACGFILKAHPVPTQSPETHELIRFDYINADGREDSKMITHDEMRQRYSDLRMSNYMPRPAVAVPDEVKTILRRISKWHGEFPDAPLYHGTPQSYGAAYGSNGERDYMRSLADKALQLLNAPSHDRCPSHEPQSAPGRSPQDYAIEHAEYMAVNGEQLLSYLNTIADEDEGTLMPDDQFSDYISGLRSGIYEFRKRRDRCQHGVQDSGVVDYD